MGIGEVAKTILLLTVAEENKIARPHLRIFCDMHADYSARGRNSKDRIGVAYDI